MQANKTANLLIRIGFISLTLALSGAVWALKPSHEADRLMLAAEQAFADNDRKKAEEHLNEALLLGIALPPDFNFLYGKLLVEQNKAIEARRYVEQYISQEGNAGRYYREALGLITEIENKSPVVSRTASSQSTGNRKAEISRAGNGQLPYVEHIQQLYGTNDTATALTQHLNNLLKFYAYGDERIVASTRPGTPSRHKIQFSSRGEVISFNQVGTGANSPFTEDRFSVYGVNPHVSFQCRSSTSSCWLYHPVTSQRWLQIVRNEDVALEISKALSELIRDLQKNS